MYLHMFFAGIIGIIIHCLVTIRKINKNIEMETYLSVHKKYWKMDWLSVMISLVALVGAIYISNEFLNNDLEKPMPGNIGALLQYKLQAYIKTTFLVVGYCADSAVNAFLGTTEEKLKQQNKIGGVN